MSLNAARVIVPGTGHYYKLAVDALPPAQIINISGSPTAATLPLTVGGQTGNAALSGLAAPTDASLQGNLGAIAQAVAALSTVGTGNVAVLPGFNAYQYVVIIDPSVTAQTISTTGATYTGGTSPSTTVTQQGSWSSTTEIGHTSEDSPLQINRSGGDVTTLNSWQQQAIESSTAPITYALAYNLLQYDPDNLKLYHGSNATVSAVDGSILAPQKPSATEHGLFVTIENGSKFAVRYYPRVSTLAADGESFDTSALAAMPVASQVLSSTTRAYPYSVSPVGVAA